MSIMSILNKSLDLAKKANETYWEVTAAAERKMTGGKQFDEVLDKVLDDNVIPAVQKGCDKSKEVVGKVVEQVKAKINK